VRIARALGDAILGGTLAADTRLPSEAELAVRFGVSRPTVREALKRLAARNLIRTRRGATGGAFVNRMSFEQARADLVTTETLLLSMNAVDFETACEARFALERSCLPLACTRRTPAHLARMRDEIARQSGDSLDDAGFCESDVAFHCTLVDSAGNPVLGYHLAAAVEAMQPLMNMLTFSRRSRGRIVALHLLLTDAIEARAPDAAAGALEDLAAYALELGQQARSAATGADGG